MRISPLIPMFALFAAACGSSMIDTAPDTLIAPLPSTEGIVYQADRATYRQGDTARIILRNQSAEPLGYNLCFSSRELRSGGGWTRFSPLRMCTLELRGLAPGAETFHLEPITAEWKPGEYRVVTAVERGRDRGEIFTPPFTVTR